MNSEKARRNDSAAVMNIVHFDEEARRPCRPTSEDALLCSERTPRLRCDHAHRELYRNHFPAER